MIALISTGLTVSDAIAQEAGDKIKDSYVCVFKKGAVGRGNEQSEAAAAAKSAGGSVTQVYTAALKGFAARLPDQAVARLRASNPKIDYCEQDQVVTTTRIGAQAKPASGGNVSTQTPQETPWGVARVGGGLLAGPFASAWVIDTGIDATHPDLNVDTSRSRSFLNTSSFLDENGHGTHVAGTIAAKNNSIGVVGVAPGAPVVAVRVLDRRGSGSISGVIAGVDYVAKTAGFGDVANMSLGGGQSTALDTAVKNAAAVGISFTIAAGNSSDLASNYSPARVNGVNVFTVSAFGAGDLFAGFSNYGNPPVDFAEPGVSIKSTWLGGSYNTISGTSMAAPHLAGLLLLGEVMPGGQVNGDRDVTPDVIGIH